MESTSFFDFLHLSMKEATPPKGNYAIFPSETTAYAKRLRAGRKRAAI
jgi:hypothetical protein